MALAAILVEGIIFIILSLFKFREALVNSVPANLKYGISAGIGLFIAIVGLKGAGVIIGDASTLVALGDVGSAAVVLSIVGLLIIGVMWHFKVRGAILWGILITWVLGMLAEVQRLVQRRFHHSQPGAGKPASSFAGADLLPV